jgi:small subunit ribosomal protein S13e
LSAKEVAELVCRLSRKGLMPSQIGAILRDSNGVPQVKPITGNKILRILKSNGLQIIFFKNLSPRSWSINT